MIQRYRKGTCKNCGGKDRQLIAGLCIESPVFCYQKRQQEKYNKRRKEKAKQGLGTSVAQFSGTNKDLKPVFDAVLKTTQNRKKKTSAGTIPSLLRLATIVFNRYIRERDSENGKFKCICCLKWFSTDVMDAAHYMSAGKHPATRYDEENVNGCCQGCNRFLEGNLDAYRINLNDKIGALNLYNLELKARAIYKWQRDHILEIIKKYK